MKTRTIVSILKCKIVRENVNYYYFLFQLTMVCQFWRRDLNSQNTQHTSVSLIGLLAKIVYSIRSYKLKRKRKKRY